MEKAQEILRIVANVALSILLGSMVTLALAYPFVVLKQINDISKRNERVALTVLNDVIYIYRRIDWHYPTYLPGYRIEITKDHFDSLSMKLHEIIGE